MHQKFWQIGVLDPEAGFKECFSRFFKDNDSQ